MRYLVLALCLAAGAGAARAENGTDPDWPCVQRKQPHLSLGQMWSGPEPDEAARELARTPEIAALADRLEQRRLPLAEAEAEIAEFARDADNQKLTALMVAIFDRIEPHRAALIAGIARYGHKQVDLAQRIEDHRAKMEQMQKAETPDFDAIDAEEERLDWDMRIFQDRQQALTYVCETPVILEQRVFALARAIAAGLR
ncbi:hypothetical protein ACDP63_06940 [Paracoccus sp. P2]|uniref:Uncharacterized protein n=1 Tax=Paracoccus pantotrophus TaxID=82367 RepID=A0A1I5GP26_PARPN|nr:hypothetical protein [Paracoccus pantotrophus]MDF3854394.1 hypothetical protein [Paracoccus pantotrophus]QFG38516.1 hypothetical protein ESD82_21175 [Paracoccus pantotrophus]QLH16197.1 hypothetical protein HYQ43_19110 [Paracoccus pantotrophus]RDE01982.1 hypothetical protein DTW92_00185 [Paracoccus pantotrophus]RKS50952.1 hypothetical protein BDE18_0166 [Paracoccus pantotrophus]